MDSNAKVRDVQKALDRHLTPQERRRLLVRMASKELGLLLFNSLASLAHWLLTLLRDMRSPPASDGILSLKQEQELARQRPWLKDSSTSKDSPPK
jgi:hypothetical protein